MTDVRGQCGDVFCLVSQFEFDSSCGVVVRSILMYLKLASSLFELQIAERAFLYRSSNVEEEAH